MATQFECIAAASSIPDLFSRLEAQGQLLRLDPSVDPTVYRCATVSRAELDALRRIESVVRLGRVRSIHPTRMELEHGDLPVDPDALYIDCSADGIPAQPSVPVFDGDTINLLTVQVCQPTFSAALIAYVESHVADDARRNAMCGVVPLPKLPTDWIRMWAASLGNRSAWAAHPGLTGWMTDARLYPGAARHAGEQESQADRKATSQRIRSVIGAVSARLPELVAQIH